MDRRVESWLWLAQRSSAAVLAVAVVVHLATIIYAVQRGLSAEAILSRLQGNELWLVFYGVFVLAIAVHAPIGLRNVLSEWAPGESQAKGNTWVDAVCALWAGLLAFMGFTAALVLYLPPALASGVAH